MTCPTRHSCPFDITAYQTARSKLRALGTTPNVTCIRLEVCNRKINVVELLVAYLDVEMGDRRKCTGSKSKKGRAKQWFCLCSKPLCHLLIFTLAQHVQIYYSSLVLHCKWFRISRHGTHVWIYTYAPTYNYLKVMPFIYLHGTYNKHSEYSNTIR